MFRQKTRWFLSALLAVVFVLGFSQLLDRRAAKPVDDAFKQALVTFAVVRGINAVVSVIQGTELALEPAGVGVVLTPGQIFDPVNDLIERFSWIMLAASTSLGAQKILIGIGEAPLVQVLLLVAVAILLVVIWRPDWLNDGWRDLAMRLAMLILFVRFAVPVMVLVNDSVYETFLADRYQTSYTALKQTRDEVEALQSAKKGDTATTGNRGFLGRIGQWYDRTTENLDIEANIAQYRERFARASEHIVRLIVIFLLHTVVFPLLFLWLGIRLLRGILKSST